MAYFDLALDDLRAYRPEVAEPDDFDEFWASSIEQARSHELNLRTEQIDARAALIDVYDVTFAGFGGQDVKGWLRVPAGNTDRLPTVVSYIGYSGGRGMPLVTPWVAAGYAHLELDTRGQGWNTVTSFESTPDADANAGNGNPGRMTQGIADPATYYYRRLLIDVVRSIDAALASDHVDPAKIFVTGGSQGGGMAIAAAGLAKLAGQQLAGALPDVPFLSHFARAITLTDSYPYKEISDHLKARPGDLDQVLTTLSYFDGVNFSRRASCPTLFSVAMMDQICPPSTVFASFNAWGAKDRQIEVYPHNGHEGGRELQTWAKLDWVRDRLAKDAKPSRRPRRGLASR